MAPTGGGAAAEAPSPEDWLRKASLARSVSARAKYAERGLSHPDVDHETRALLLRQLYLSKMERRRFDEALEIAEEMVDLAVMADVARQDAARACLGLQRRADAVKHLRIAGRVSPASRRAFHLWTLGSVLFLCERYREAVGALSRAIRWGTTERPLYEAQRALARIGAGEDPPNVRELIESLQDAPCGQGYGQFVLGLLCFHAGDTDEAKQYLDAFITRSTSGRGRSGGRARGRDRACTRRSGSNLTHC